MGVEEAGWWCPSGRPQTTWRRHRSQRSFFARFRRCLSLIWGDFHEIIFYNLIICTKIIPSFNGVIGTSHWSQSLKEFAAHLFGLYTPATELGLNTKVAHLGWFGKINFWLGQAGAPTLTPNYQTREQQRWWKILWTKFGLWRWFSIVKFYFGPVGLWMGSYFLPASKRRKASSI